MTFYVYTTPDGLNYRHDKDPRSITVLDLAMLPISPVFDVTDDCDCAASVETNRFAIGYWKDADLKLFDLDSGKVQATFPFRKIGPLATFDRSGERLLFKSGQKTVLLNTTSGTSIELKGIRALDRLIVDHSRNEAIVPSQKKNELLRVSLETGEVTPISVPLKATVFDLKLSPCKSRVIAIDRKKGLHCIETSTWSIIWSVSLKKMLGSDHMGVGQFSGDGSLFCAAVSAREHNYTIVVNSQTGEHVNTFDSICYGLPYEGSFVRDRRSQMGSYSVRTLDLASGKTGTMSLKS